MNKKTFLTVLVTAVLIMGCLYKWYYNPVKTVKRYLTNIQYELSLKNDNIIQTSKSILKILEPLSSDFYAKIDNNNIKSNENLKESVSWIKLNLSPLNIMFSYQNLSQTKSVVKLTVKVKIISSQNKEFENKEYLLNVTCKPVNKTWKIQSVIQIANQEQ